MYALDFEFDGKYLSDFGYLICTFDVPKDEDVIEAGSKITFNKVQRNKGSRHSLTNIQYEECITTTFDICKDPKMYSDRSISDDEYLELVRWLNRRKFCKLHIIDDEHEVLPCYFNASFNVSKIRIAGKLYGLELEMETDRPFGYGRERKITHTFSSAGESFYLIDNSDEIGYIYPSMKITCGEGGDFCIQNKIGDDNVTANCFVKECTQGEVITIDGNTRHIASNKRSAIADAFSYEYLKLGNTSKTRKNKITIPAGSIPCTIEFTYSPIIKNSPN